MVDAAKEYIAAGDIFQVVLSQRFEAPFELPPFVLSCLAAHQSGAFSLFPEFRQLCDCRFQPRNPGARPRPYHYNSTIRGDQVAGGHSAQDKLLELELLADEKERAEHLMLLDLGRNDVGPGRSHCDRNSNGAVLDRALQSGNAYCFQRRRSARPHQGCA